MAIDVKKALEPMAVKLRKQGFSYSQIQKEIYVPKSTLSSWLKKIKLTEAQTGKLRERQLRAAKAGSEKKSLRTAQLIEEIKISSAKDVSKISKRELWLMGVMLYWRERLSNDNESDLRKGVRFTSSDPHLVKLFLKWLNDIGKIADEEIGFDIFAGENKYNRGGRRNEKSENNVEARNKVAVDVINYWSEITGFPKNNFTHVYFQKVRPKKRGIKKRKISGKARFGLLRIRVKASSMLARQIAGWTEGIKRACLN